MSNHRKENKSDPWLFGHPKSWWEAESYGYGTGRRYSAAFRKAAVAAIRERGEASLVSICRQLGISAGAYWLWRTEARENPKAKGKQVIQEKRRERRERHGRPIAKFLRELVS